MTRIHLPLLLAAGMLAACNDRPMPTESARARDPEKSLVLVTGYAAQQLPLLPNGINNAGAIVGTVGSDAAYYANGTLTHLTRLADAAGTYEARAINGRGAIAGDVVSGVGLLWPAADQAPYKIIPPPSYTSTLTPRGVTAMSVNDSNVVVGSYLKSGIPRAFRWTLASGVVDITPPGYAAAVALDIDDAGWIVGYGQIWAGGYKYALRWDPSGNASTLDGIEADAINASGVAVGIAGIGLVQWPLGTTSGQRLVAPQGGKSRVDDISDAGRTVGVAANCECIGYVLAPWTSLAGDSTFLPLNNLLSTSNVTGLRVNGCGSIIGTQLLNDGTRVGLLWSKLSCDYTPTRLAL